MTVYSDQLVNICCKLLLLQTAAKPVVNLLNTFICLELSIALFRTEDCFTKLNQSLKWPAKWKMISLHFTDSWLRHKQTKEKNPINFHTQLDNSHKWFFRRWLLYGTSSIQTSIPIGFSCKCSALLQDISTEISSCSSEKWEVYLLMVRSIAWVTT